MKLYDLVDEDFVNYKKPSLYLLFPYCTFKCEKECGLHVCQNSEIAKGPVIEVDAKKIAKRYADNAITEAIVMAGLEPLDSFEDIKQLLDALREINFYPDIVIYTGYWEEEVKDKIQEIVAPGDFHIIVKYGRFVPDRPHREDPILGVELASDNQYAVEYNAAL